MGIWLGWFENRERFQYSSNAKEVQIERVMPMVFHPEYVATQLREGIDTREAIWLFITIWMLRQQIGGFQPVYPSRKTPFPPSLAIFWFK